MRCLPWLAAAYLVVVASFCVSMFTPWFLAGCLLLFAAPPLFGVALWKAVR